MSYINKAGIERSGVCTDCLLTMPCNNTKKKGDKRLHHCMFLEGHEGEGRPHMCKHCTTKEDIAKLMRRLLS